MMTVVPSQLPASVKTMSLHQDGGVNIVVSARDGTVEVTGSKEDLLDNRDMESDSGDVLWPR